MGRQWSPDHWVLQKPKTIWKQALSYMSFRFALSYSHAYSNKTYHISISGTGQMVNPTMGLDLKMRTVLPLIPSYLMT